MEAQQQVQQQPTQYWQIGKNLSDCMQELYANCLWSDVKFRCKDHEDEERIYAHKIVLAARSPVFQEMFFGVWTQSSDDVELKEADKKTFDLFLRYVYTDTVPDMLDKDTASALLQIAHMYQVPALVQLCANYLAKWIQIENACEMLILADYYQISSLKEASCRFIDQHAHDVIKSAGFLELPKQCLLYLLQRDTFYEDEGVIFEKAEEWAINKAEAEGLEKTGANLREMLGECFYYLRLPAMSYNALVKYTRNKGYLSAEEYITIVDFINNIPDTIVASNSCVARAPITEKIVLDGQDGDIKDAKDLSCSLMMQVEKNVKILGFTINFESTLRPSRRLYKHVATGETSIDLHQTEALADFVSDYVFPCKVVGFGRFSKPWRSRDRRILVYEEFKEFNFSRCIEKIASGYICVENSLKKNFEIKIEKGDSKICLDTPLVLEKRDLPYKVEWHLESERFLFSDDLNVYLQSCLRKCKENIQSKSGHVKLSSVSDTFLRSLDIETESYHFSEKEESQQNVTD